MPDFVISRFDDSIQGLELLDQYLVDKVKVFITKDGRYIVQEPTLSHEAEKTWSSLMKSIHSSFPHQKVTKDDIIPILKETLETESRKTDNFEMWKKEKESIEYYMARDLTGYSEIDVLMRDKHIEDILSVKWNSPISIVHKKYPHFTFLYTNILFKTEEQMSKLIQRISQSYGEPPNEIKPVTSFTNPDLVRFTMTGNKKVTPDGPTMSIRKPSIDLITVCHLLKGNVLSVLAACYLWIVMDLKGFGLVIGTPGTGKTTLINAIFTMSNPRWHYYTIEDTLELKLQHQNVSRHQTTANSVVQSTSKNANNFDVFDLCKLSLRFRPDFVAVGEILGKEAEGLFQVAASGSGCMCSFHATNTDHALTKLEAPPISISKASTSLITYVLRIAWITRKKKRIRRILSIDEPIAVPNDEKQTKKIRPIFVYSTQKDQLIEDDIDKLIERSEKLKEARTILGIDDLKEDIEKRMKILQKILDDNITNPELISGEIFQYYRN